MILDWKYLGENYIHFSSLISVKHMSEWFENIPLSYQAPDQYYMMTRWVSCLSKRRIFKDNRGFRLILMTLGFSINIANYFPWTGYYAYPNHFYIE